MLVTQHPRTFAFARGDGEEEEYDFEYSDEEEEETDVDLENSYYAAKGLKQEDPRAAVEAFREIMGKEEEQGIWGFKALKQMMKLLFSMSEFQEFTHCYTQLLGYTKGAVTQNIGEKGVSSVLDYVSSSNDWNLLKGFYEQTLDTLREHKNNRLWFKCNLKLGRLMYEVGDMARLQRIIKELLSEEAGPAASSVPPAASSVPPAASSVPPAASSVPPAASPDPKKREVACPLVV
eukprot:jgi/Undpi1/10038/HiC_scaffold_28.g12492.m1